MHDLTPNPAAALNDPLHPQRLISDRLPAWLAAAPLADRQQMRDSIAAPPTRLEADCLAQPQIARALVEAYGAQREAEAKVRMLLEPLPELLPFASTLLSDAIEARFGLTVDVNTTYLISAVDAVAYKLLLEADPVTDAQRALKLATRSLLHCALQNYEAAQAQPGGMDVDELRSVVVDSDTFVFLTPTGTAVAIDPADFAELVRELDLGGRYQTQIDAVHGKAEVTQALRDAERARLRVHLLQACLTGAIDSEVYQALLNLVETGQAYYQGSPLRCAFLHLFDSAMTGALLIGAVPSPELGLAYDPLLLPHKGLLVSYLPGAPTPLKAHATAPDLQAHLREQLTRMPSEHLRKALPEADKQRVVPRLRDSQAWVEVSIEPLYEPLFEALANQKQRRLRDDALFHAVPTAHEDRKTAQRRLAVVTSLAFDALNLGAFFIPGLGQVMMAVTLVQLGCEVYEGLESWAEGDRKQGLDYLMDVVDNVALSVALGSVGAAVEVPALEVPSFVDTLEPVALPSGDVRLWQPDLRPFAHDTLLPADLQADAHGLYHHQGKTWLTLDGSTYAVRQGLAAGQYHLEHPSKPHGHAPEVRRSGTGAWLHGLDRPRQWSGATLLRRAGPLGAGLDEAHAGWVLHASAIDEAMLRRTIARHERLPALLQDTLTRVALDQDISQTLSQATHAQRVAAFAQRYGQLPTAKAPGSALIQRLYPSLPAVLVDELARSASPAQLQQLLAGKMPLHLAEEARAYLQHVRLARAYEGLHLDAVRNGDSDRLALQGLGLQPNWPGELRVALEDCRQVPFSKTTLGPEAASVRVSIVSLDGGYWVMDEAQPALPGTVHDTLHDAVFNALSPEHRKALGVENAEGLKQLAQATTLSRDVAREVLGMRPLRPGLRSPMRLADGRLGYPLSGQGASSGGITRSNLLALIRQVGLPDRTPRSATAILAELESGGLSRQQINERLRTLLEERQALQTHLEDWRLLQGATGTVDTPGAERLATTLMQHWYDHALPELGQGEAPLRLERTTLQGFPEDLPSALVERIRHLELIDPVFPDTPGWGHLERLLRNVLRQFPSLRSLRVDRPYVAAATPSPMLFAVPLIAELLPALETLTFTHQNVPLSATDIDSLLTLRHLRRLDLSGNRLSQRYPPVFDQLSLDHLGLERMQLDHWPDGLGSRALERTGDISLRHNGIRLLPSFLLNDDLHAVLHPHLSLEGNPILDDHVQQVLLMEDARSQRFNLDINDSVRGNLAQHLARRQELRDVLDPWASASSSTTPPSPATVATRRAIGDAILEFWRNQEQNLPMSPLRLQQVDLAHFPPRLPAFFNERVRNLVLSRTRGSAAQLDAFLARFPHTTRLEIDEHQHTGSTPTSALLRLPALTELELTNLGLEVDQAMLDNLAQLRNLTALSLNGNRMGTIDSAPEALRRLTRLDLSHMGLEQWPAWVDELLPLPLLDLSDNRLTSLPEHVLDNPNHQYPVSSISLFGNPMDHDVVVRARASSDSQHSYTFALDLPDDLLLVSSDEEFGHQHAPLMPAEGDVPNQEDWLHGAEVENEALQDSWQALEQAGDAGNLLALVGRLRQSGPYRNASSRASFCQRVRKMLVMAQVNPEDRLLFNAIAEEALANPNTGDQTCHDGALLVFQNIELVIANRQLLVNAADSQATLYQELRRLFRLQALDGIARERAQTRDEAEVRLAYRQGLNAELNLGVPDDDMLYRAVADVNRTELNQAMAQVQRRERGEAFLAYAADNADWVRYLRHEHAERFATIEAHYKAQVNALPDLHPDMPLDALAQEFKVLEQEKKAQERRLVHELTILANPDRS